MLAQPRGRAPSLAQIILVAVPAMLVASASKRWLPVVMVMWLLMPIILYVGAIGIEVLVRPGVLHPIETAFDGFMIVSPVLAVPWLVGCIAGFGIGFGLRLRPRRDGPYVQPRPP